LRKVGVDHRIPNNHPARRTHREGATREAGHLVGGKVVVVELAGVVLLVPGSMLALICVLAGAAVVLCVPEALLHWRRQHREDRRGG